MDNINLLLFMGGAFMGMMLGKICDKYDAEWRETDTFKRLKKTDFMKQVYKNAGK